MPYGKSVSDYILHYISKYNNNYGVLFIDVCDRFWIILIIQMKIMTKTLIGLIAGNLYFIVLLLLLIFNFLLFFKRNTNDDTMTHTINNNIFQPTYRLVVSDRHKINAEVINVY